MKHLIWLVALAACTSDDPTVVPPATAVLSVETVTTDLIGGDGLALLPDGRLRVGEPHQDRIQTLDPTTGEVTPFVNDLDEPYGISLGSDDLLYVANWAARNVLQIDDAGGVTEFATLTDRAGNVYVDPSTGDVYLPSFNTGVVERVTPSGVRSHVSTGLENQGLHAVMLDDQQRMYTGYVLNGEIYRHDANGVGTLFAAIPGRLGNLLWHDGAMYATGWDTASVYVIDAEGLVETFAGTGREGRVDGPIDEARFRQPNGLAVDVSANVMYVSESIGRVRRIALE